MSEPIKINIIKESTCILYSPQDAVIGVIDSIFKLNDVRIQIKKLALPGYYFIWNDMRLTIDGGGHLDAWPVGFFDALDSQYDKLIDWGKSDPAKYTEPS